MRIKALDTFETTRFLPQEDEYGSVSLHSEKLEMKDGDIAEIDDALANRLIGHGLVSEDLDAETRAQKMQRETAAG
jgi:hypothetical protein